jgi:hypothetical protein
MWQGHQEQVYLQQTNRWLTILTVFLDQFAKNVYFSDNNILKKVIPHWNKK